MRLGEMYDVAGLKSQPRPFCAIAGQSDGIFPNRNSRRVSLTSDLKKLSMRLLGVGDRCVNSLSVKVGTRYYKNRRMALCAAVFCGIKNWCQPFLIAHNRFSKMILMSKELRATQFFDVVSVIVDPDPQERCCHAKTVDLCPACHNQI